MAQILEASMLVCFGLSWPINLIKNIKAQTAKSMSLKFILLIITGYIAGIAAKFINHQITYVLIIYILNLAIVSVNLAVYFINKHKDKKAEAEKMRKQNAKSDRKLTAIEQQYSRMNEMATRGGNVILGSNFFKGVNFNELAQSRHFEENIYNRSIPNTTIDQVCKMLDSCITTLKPKKVFINLGEEDLKKSDFNMQEFIANYEWLLYTINSSTKAKIYTVSVNSGNRNTALLNNEIKKISENYGCKFIDITSAVNSTDPALKTFDALKAFMRTKPISFYEAMSY